MQYSIIRESIIAQERRRDRLRRAEQNRLIRLAKASRSSNEQAGRPSRAGSRFRLMWRRAAV